MSHVYKSILDKCVNCCAPPPPPNITSLTWECQSWEGGGATLCGYAAFRPTGNTQDAGDPTAPWNAGKLKRYRRMSWEGYSATYFSEEYDGDPPRTFVVTAGSAFTGHTIKGWDGSACSETSTFSSSNVTFGGWMDEATPPASGNIVDCTSVGQWAENTGFSGSSAPSYYSDTTNVIPNITTLQKVAIPTYPDDERFEQCTTVVFTLSDEVYLDDALETIPDPVEGTSCTSYVDPLDPVPNGLGPEPVVLGDSRMVEVHLAATSDSPSACFIITLRFYYGPMGNPDDPWPFNLVPYPEEETVQLSICTDGSSEWAYTYVIPAPEPGYARKFAGATWANA